MPAFAIRSTRPLGVALIVAFVVPVCVERVDAGGEERCDGEPATIVGTNGPDNLSGTAGRDVIQALDGADSIDGRGGNDLICGGP